jgi:hypothetical protein
MILLREAADANGGRLLLVAQPAHAQLSGQFARAWDFSALPHVPEAAREAVILGITLHDLSWVGFEAAPTLNTATGLPHMFREVPAHLHTARWAASVDHAGAFGAWPALLVSLHGIRIYEKFFPRARAAAEDVVAADAFLAGERTRHAALLRAAGASAEAAFAADLLTGACDWMSLLFCGDPMRTARVPDVPLRSGVGEIEVRLDGAREGTITPWPFAADHVCFTCEARVLPADARFDDEGAMRATIAAAPRERLGWRLAKA